MSNKSSTNAERHPYQKLSFWRERRNQFWEDYSRHMSEKTRDYYREWYQRMIAEEKRPFILDQAA